MRWRINGSLSTSRHSAPTLMPRPDTLPPGAPMGLVTPLTNEVIIAGVPKEEPSASIHIALGTGTIFSNARSA